MRGAGITGSTGWVEWGRGCCLGNSDMEKAVGMRPVPPGSQSGVAPAAPKALLVGVRKAAACARGRQALPPANRTLAATVEEQL